MNLSNQDYVAKICNASPLQLVNITFELILLNIEESKSFNKKEKMFEQKVKNARNFLTQLRNSLNMNMEISHQLLSIYNFVDYLLANYLFNGEKNLAQDSIKILSNIHDAFKEIEKNEPDKKSVMQNSEQIFAGLTYDKNGNLQEYINPNKNRGFKA